MLLYSEKVIDHYRRPRHWGEIDGATASVEATNPVCGDILKLWAVVRDGQVSEASFKVEGCIPAIACASLLTELMIGKEVAELGSITAGEIEAALDGLPSASRHASALAVGGLRQLLEKIR